VITSETPRRPSIRIIGTLLVPKIRDLLHRRFEVRSAEEAARCEGVFAVTADRVDAATLAESPGLRGVATVTIGTDHIDVAHCTRRGIPVANSGDATAETVAGAAMTLVSATMRGLVFGAAQYRDGVPPFTNVRLGREPAGKTLGIVGFGNIGERLAGRARRLGMRVVYANRKPRGDDARTGACARPIEALLRESDCVVALLPGGAATRGFFDRTRFAQMKPGAFFVNVGRGTTVDHAALAAALEDGPGPGLAGAALDVTDPEPLPVDHPLRRSPKVLITPHIAAATDEAREAAGARAVANLEAALRGAPMPDCVNPAVYDAHPPDERRSCTLG